MSSSNIPSMERSQISPKIGLKSAPKTSPEIRTQIEKQPKLLQSREMDHEWGYRGPIWVIQKPNIKFKNATKTSMKDMSPKSLIVLTLKLVPKSSQCKGSKSDSILSFHNLAK